MFNNTISFYDESQNYSHGYASIYNRTGNIRYITWILNALRLATSLIRYLRTKITEINIINIDAFELLEINRYTKEREENSVEITRQLGYHPLASYFYRRFCVYEYFAPGSY